MRGFLAYISEEGKGRVDLVVVGDFLELWQTPEQIECKGPNSDYGCSLDELEEMVGLVLAAHRKDFGLLAKFAATNENCVHIVPGNHDAALLIDRIWAPVKKALQADGGCVSRPESGRWTSEDGRVVAEHGHQIGWDPNRYGKWPTVTAEIEDRTFLRRPWGEQFVQRLFNETETEYPLVDNLSPSSAGAKYRMRDRTAGQNAKDIARFLKFNLMETSLRQKLRILGERDPTAPPEWDIESARLLGADLFLLAMAEDDPMVIAAREAVSEDGLREALAALAADPELLPDDEVLALCDQIEVRGGDVGCETTTPGTLGAAISRLVSSRKRTVGPYVKKIWKEAPRVRVFVYGHTHAFEKEWVKKMNGRKRVAILNDGAFQRVIDDSRFRALAKSKGLENGEALRQLSLDDLPPCYTFVRVTKSPLRGIERELLAWYQEEGSDGMPVDVCDKRCANVGHGCS